jgi:hypothetical protein
MGKTNFIKYSPMGLCVINVKYELPPMLYKIINVIL